jgi:hypothetical protein
MKLYKATAQQLDNDEGDKLRQELCGCCRDGKLPEKNQKSLNFNGDLMDLRHVPGSVWSCWAVISLRAKKIKLYNLLAACSLLVPCLAGFSNLMMEAIFSSEMSDCLRTT